MVWKLFKFFSCSLQASFGVVWSRCDLAEFVWHVSIFVRFRRSFHSYYPGLQIGGRLVLHGSQLNWFEIKVSLGVFTCSLVFNIISKALDLISDTLAADTAVVVEFAAPSIHVMSEQLQTAIENFVLTILSFAMEFWFVRLISFDLVRQILYVVGCRRHKACAARVAALGKVTLLKSQSPVVHGNFWCWCGWNGWNLELRICLRIVPK